MDVNVASMFLTCRAAVPAMRERGGGAIVNISSGTPFRGVPFLLHYVTSKGAIVAFTRALAKELGKDGIRVNCVAPGFTMTEGVQQHPEVIEKLRDVSVAARTHPARPGARGRRRRRRVPGRPGRGVRHRPDDRHRRRDSTSIEALAVDRADGVPPEERGQPRRLRRRRAARRGTAGGRRRARARVAAQDGDGDGASLRSTSSSTRRSEWIVRCDRVDFPRGCVAHRHVHPGPGIRRLLHGELEIERAGGTRSSLRVRPGSSGGPEPVVAVPPRRARPRSCACSCCRASGRGGGRSGTWSRSTTTAPKLTAGSVARAADRRCRVSRTGGRILVDQLALHGADLAFGVPGESYIDVLDALRDSPVRFVTCRHEAGAANMAEAYGKLTGRPGICMVTRGPGATQPSVASTRPSRTHADDAARRPGADRSRRSRGVQELDSVQMFGSFAKWAAQVDRVERIPELARARVPRRDVGSPGAVVVSRCRRTCSPSARKRRTRRPMCRGTGGSGGGELAAALDAARGRRAAPCRSWAGQPWTRRAGSALAAWCEASGIPVAASWRCQDYVDNTSPCYAGHLGARPGHGVSRAPARGGRAAGVGARLGDIETGGYTTARADRPRQLADPRLSRPGRAGPRVRARARHRRQRPAVRRPPWRDTARCRWDAGRARRRRPTPTTSTTSGTPSMRARAWTWAR